jgi:hypothetical protein
MVKARPDTREDRARGGQARAEKIRRRKELRDQFDVVELEDLSAAEPELLERAIARLNLLIASEDDPGRSAEGRKRALRKHLSVSLFANSFLNGTRISVASPVNAVADRGAIGSGPGRPLPLFLRHACPVPIPISVAANAEPERPETVCPACGGAGFSLRLQTLWRWTYEPPPLCRECGGSGTVESSER